MESLFEETAERAPQIALSDIEQLVQSGSPDVQESLREFLQQPEPEYPTPRPEGLVTVSELLSQLRSARSLWRGKAGRKKESTLAWRRFLDQPPGIPGRFKLADSLTKLYQDGTAEGRAILIEIAKSAEMYLGLWGALKRIYKLAEARFDAEMWGALAWRFDVEAAKYYQNEVSRGTLMYLRRRAWRFLNSLGRSAPELYASFAVEVLRHYNGSTYFNGTWVGSHILNGGARYNRGDYTVSRAHTAAWKFSPDPLMFLLETCTEDAVARFAVQSLRKDFPEKLRRSTPVWLARLAQRNLESVHEFLIDTLQDSPDFHQGKLKSIGLHDTVLSLLRSPSQKARKYAVEYAQAHAKDMTSAKLVELVVEAGYSETAKFALALLKTRDAKEIGYELLAKLLANSDTSSWASKTLNETFERGEIPEKFLIDMFYGDYRQREWVKSYLSAKYKQSEMKSTFWTNVLDDKRHSDNYSAMREAITMLSKFSVKNIDASWLLNALTNDQYSWDVMNWLSKADSLPGLDIERLKGLVFNHRTRHTVLGILGNTKLVKPRDLGLSWLLALARRPDATLHEFAQRYLLANMEPEDFSELSSGTSKDHKKSGIERLFNFALSGKEPESVRTFAQTYLRCHHPVLGPDQPESKQHDIKPKVERSAYAADKVWAALDSAHADVRRFAVIVVKTELRAWGYHTRVYALADSEAKEVRNVCYTALLNADDAGRDDNCTLRPEEIDSTAVFAMAESRKRSSREVAMELIRRHYARLGGAQRLGWLMQSADRDVRMFSIRLLWEKHRPRQLPKDWQPKVKPAANQPLVVVAEPFADLSALREFLRTTMFALPPGRSMEQKDDTGIRRHIAAGDAKRHVVDVVRDFGIENVDFARTAAPVMSDFTASVALGEWQACLAALSHWRRAHPDVDWSVASTHEGA